MKAGFIGTGSMGSILIHAFITSGALKPENMTISNRTEHRALLLRQQFPQLTVVKHNVDVVERSDVIFICVKPLEFKPVIDQIRDYVRQEQIIVSITSPVMIALLEEQLNCKIAKVIPSITNYVCSGVSLCMYGSRMNTEDVNRLERVLRSISTPLKIDESFTRISSDLSSCGPAFLSYFIQQFIEAAVQETGLPQAEATSLASQMLLGTGKLLTSGEFTPTSLQQHVSVPGGITAEGLKLMSEHIGGMFKQLIHATHAKYEDDLVKVNKAFNLS